jgi:hypothetical protein
MLKIQQEMELPRSLKYTEFETSTIINKNEAQLEEMAYRSQKATSGNSSSIEWNLTSISGSSIKRKLEHVIPVDFSIQFKGITPAVFLKETSASVNNVLLGLVFGSSPMPFNTLQNTFDQGVLSKIFREREYIINNSSTILQERFEPYQIDVMIAQACIKKMENDGLEPFAAANTHFSTFASDCGGCFMPINWYDGTTAYSQQLLSNSLGVIDATAQSLYDKIMSNTRTRYASAIANSWQSRRNAARNIVDFQITEITNDATGNPILTTNIASAFGDQEVPYSALSSAYNSLDVYKKQSVFIPSDSFTVKFTVTFREELWSNFFYNDYQEDQLVWNELLPASALSVKYTVNQDYLNNGFLQIGDSVRNLLLGTPNFGTSAPAQLGVYKIVNVSIGDYTKCYLNLFQQKIPVHFQDRKQAYKCLFYDQVRSQGAKDISLDGNVFSATQDYSNLSQMGDYILITLPINKGNYLKAMYTSGAVPPQSCLPSTFNLPITDLVMSFGNEVALGTYGLDQYQLQKMTYDNLQELKELKDVVVGKSKSMVKETNTWGSIIAYKTAANGGDITNQIGEIAGLGLQTVDNITQSSGVSNSQFVLLKLGKDVRLPYGMTAGMVLTFNLSITVSCDLNKIKAPLGHYDDVKVLREIASVPQTATLAQLDVVFYQKRLWTLSGPQYGTTYVHNIIISSGEYIAILTKFKEGFSSMVRDDIYDARMMLGGSVMGRVKQGLDWLKPRVKKAVEIAQKGAQLASHIPGSVGATASLVNKGLDVANNFLGSGDRENMVYAGAMSNEVMAGRQSNSVTAGRKGKAAPQTNWRNLL